MGDGDGAVVETAIVILRIRDRDNQPKKVELSVEMGDAILVSRGPKEPFLVIRDLDDKTYGWPWNDIVSFEIVPNK